MKINPKVSVIIPVYNVEKYIKKCLHSVLNQTLYDIEIICIDDASMDDSLNIVEIYAGNDPRVSIYCLGENRGQSYARNCGMEKATGKYVYFLDSDDYLESTALEKLYLYAETYQLQGVFFGTYVEYEGKPSQNEKVGYSHCKKVMSGKEFFMEKSRIGEYQSAACLQFWLREYIEKKQFRFYEGIFYEDTLYTLQVLLGAEHVMCVGDMLYHYRKHDSSTTAKRGKEQLKSYMTVYYEILKIWMQAEEKEEIGKAIRKRLETFHHRISMAVGEWGDIPGLHFEEGPCQYLYEKITLIPPEYEYIDKEKIKRKMTEEIGNYDHVYIYGAGVIADEAIRYMEKSNHKIDGVVVTHRKEGQKSYKGYSVYEPEELQQCSGKIIMLLALSVKYHEEVKERIGELGYAYCNILTD